MVNNTTQGFNNCSDITSIWPDTTDHMVQFPYGHFNRATPRLTIDYALMSPRLLTFHKDQWSLYVPPGITFNNSTFCPHNVFICFVWISEQTANISIYSINRLVFITETKCLLRGTDWVFIYNSTFCPHCIYVFCMNLRTNRDYFPIQH